jgi:hypothetical protein
MTLEVIDMATSKNAAEVDALVSTYMTDEGFRRTAYGQEEAWKKGTASQCRNSSSRESRREHSHRGVAQISDSTRCLCRGRTRYDGQEFRYEEET